MALKIKVKISLCGFLKTVKGYLKGNFLQIPIPPEYFFLLRHSEALQGNKLTV